jgi:hypothetical protein
MKHASIFIHKKIQEKIRIIHRNNRWDRTQVINTPTRRDKTHLHNSLQKKKKKKKSNFIKKKTSKFIHGLHFCCHSSMSQFYN